MGVGQPIDVVVASGKDLADTPDMIGALRLVGRITRYDAPASVRQGYTLAEVRAIAPRATVIRMWPFRFALLLSK